VAGGGGVAAAWRNIWRRRRRKGGSSAAYGVAHRTLRMRVTWHIVNQRRAVTLAARHNARRATKAWRMALARRASCCGSTAT
jgi:hypothetical protein